MLWPPGGLGLGGQNEPPDLRDFCKRWDKRAQSPKKNRVTQCLIGFSLRLLVLLQVMVSVSEAALLVGLCP